MTSRLQTVRDGGDDRRDPDRATQAVQLIARMRAARGDIYPEWELTARTDPDLTEASNRSYELVVGEGRHGSVKALGHDGITDMMVLIGYDPCVSLTMTFYGVPAAAAVHRDMTCRAGRRLRTRQPASGRRTACSSITDLAPGLGPIRRLTMKRSTYRILTTHCGSLPRPNDLLEMLMARDQGRLHDLQAFRARVHEAIGECVRRQKDTGLDIVNDGEWSKPDYSTYVKNRFTGFEGEPTPLDTSRDMLDSPEFAPYRRTGLQQLRRPTCNGRSPGRTLTPSSVTLITPRPLPATPRRSS
jgi:Cobalamin-independent synthase, Catalytic domain